MGIDIGYIPLDKRAFFDLRLMTKGQSGGSGVRQLSP